MLKIYYIFTKMQNFKSNKQKDFEIFFLIYIKKTQIFNLKHI